MSAVDVRTRRVAFYGRVADELTRHDLTPRQFGATLTSHARRAVVKDDGWFAFADLPAGSYDIDLRGPHYQPRRFTVPAPPSGSTAIVFDGEDELQVIVTGRDPSGRIDFAAHEFVPPIPGAAAVLGEGGVATTLDDPVEGVSVAGAELASVAGIAVGNAMRIVRSPRLLLRPGPYYPFPPGTTLVAFRVMDAPGGEPIAGAQVRITHLNDAALTSSVVAGVTLYRTALPPIPPPPGPVVTTPFMLGTDAARTTYANERGDAVLYYPADTPLRRLTVDVSRPGYVSQAITLGVVPQQRTSQVVQLIRS